MGGKFHLKLNNGERPIANKYREGKMKRTLKRELKVLEIAKREALKTSDMLCQSLSPLWVASQLATLCACRKGGGGFLIQCQSRSIRTVGEGSEKGRSASVKSRYSTSALDGGSNGAPLAAWSRVPIVLSVLIAMLCRRRRAVLGVVIRCAITILYEMVFIDPSWNTDQGV